MTANTCELNVGRLLEIRLHRGFETVADVEKWIGVLDGIYARVPEPTQIVIAADWSQCQRLSPEASQRAVTMFAKGNHRIERSGILGANAMPAAVLQFVTMAMQSKHPQRRVFTDIDEMTRWLSELLTGEEVKRLKIFMAAGTQKSV